MASKRSKKSPARRVPDAVRNFDIENPDLPDWIAGHALHSGGFPYDSKLKRRVYERDLEALQHELIKVQDWADKAGERIVIVWEGRDTAGKGGAIKRFTEHLNPRRVRIAALPKPTEREQGEWYLQRYVAHLPTAGEMTLFDRSWYNRAGVEPVMGFCTPEDTADFLEEVPKFEAMLVRDGTRLVKFWLTIGREEQLRRLHARRHDPLKRWKLSPIDFEAASKWDAYTRARQTMFEATDTSLAPWTVVKANDKRRARIACIRHFLSTLDYDQKDARIVASPDPAIVGSAFDDMD